MAEIREIRDLPLSALNIGTGQVRVKIAEEGIAELASSIAAVGLLEPIVVVETDEPEKFEILTGQRRFLAHTKLGRETIKCAILDERVDDIDAKVISLTENLVRADLTTAEKIDACTWLYNKYGSIGSVAEHTGLSQNTVREYVKFDRLLPSLQALVKEGEVDIKNALRAQDAATAAGEGESSTEEEAVVLAKEMSALSGAQAEKLKKDRIQSPDKPVAAVISDSRSGKIIQTVVTLTSSSNEALSQFASTQGQTKDDAAATLIERALTEEGLLSADSEG